MNDPNGLYYRDGQWHLYYQHALHADGGLKYWGHAMSHDLTHWDDRPSAISPGEFGEIYSGSAVVADDGLVHAFYTGHRPGLEVQVAAVSADGGETFGADEVILDHGLADFRDPKVFRFGAEWRMIVSALQAAEIYASTDLRSWRKVGEIEPPQPNYGWECPDLVRFGDHWLVVGSFIIPGSPQQTFVRRGDFNGARFEPTGPWRRLSFGPDDYAAVTWFRAPDERRVAIGWMGRWDYAFSVPGETWRGAMTLPREWHLDGDHLVQKPVAEVERFFRPGPFDGQPGRLRVTLAPGEAVRFADDLEETAWVGRDSEGLLILGRNGGAARAIGGGFAGEFRSDNPSDGEMHIYFDHTSVEVFADEGRTYGAMQWFPADGELTLGAPTPAEWQRYAP